MGKAAKVAPKGKGDKTKDGFAKPKEAVEATGIPTAATLAAWALRVFVFMNVLNSAYNIRLYAIKEYGRVIHEFDPWFNYRATEYLAEHGMEKFFKWYDHMSWYPLGRPVGTTIYPGMQITSVYIWETLKMFPDWAMSLNDVCCFVPAWFGVIATAFLGLLTWECSGSANAGVAASAVMAIIPAHIMRSVGGGYDNESIAVTAMCATFYFWVRSLRNDNSWWWGAVAGVAYIYMVAVWGGYIFVLNMVGLHAAVLLFTGRYTSKLHHSYTLWYVIGTLGAIQVPVVGWTPLKSLEQLAPFGLFIALQLMEFCEYKRRSENLDDKQMLQLRMKILAGAGMGFALAAALLYPTGYFGPLSSRIRGLFVKHTRTGNPLVDSVAEHQPASASAYWQFLHYCYYVSPLGFILTCFNKNDQKIFLLAYGATAYYFANRMMRLMIIAGPAASALTGVFLAYLFEFAATPIFREMGWVQEDAGLPWIWSKPAATAAEAKKELTPKYQQRKEKSFTEDPEIVTQWEQGRKTRMGVGLFLCLIILPFCAMDFTMVCHQMAIGMSNPQLMFKANLRDGSQVMVDDYREAYWWLRDKTPEDSRVMAWWDYGYQITGIANRTSIADGNTWNHEHIATLGRMLTSPVKDAHRAIRHLADFVLVWAGGGGDDMAKSPHLARIANSVYEGHCKGDPTCQLFGFNQDGSPTPMMKDSLLYQLVQNGLVPGVSVDSDRFQQVFSSKFGKVRIYRVMSVDAKSKAWVADPSNRICDAPGSWYCTGQYPPALKDLIAKRKNFAQLEDFNNGDADTKKRSEKYQKEYMKRMDSQGGGHGRRL